MAMSVNSSNEYSGTSSTTNLDSSGSIIFSQLLAVAESDVEFLIKIEGQEKDPITES